MKIFLSHSSRDKVLVRRLAQDLRRRDFQVWLDEWEIAVGDVIPQKVQEGLRDAEFIAVWLSKSAVVSGWVTKEWQTKIYQEITSQRVTVLPLLGEDCELPMFLGDKRYADFRTSYREGLTSLLDVLQRRAPTVKTQPPFAASLSVTHYTKGFLSDLSETAIPLPIPGNINLIRSLKALPRSGKLLRLEGFVPRVPIRSIYDHVLSLAHSADCLLRVVDAGIHNRARVELARCIAYHDLCEVILGDVPQYTRLNRSKRNRARVVADIRLSQLPLGEPERITNEFLSMYLQESERESLKTVTRTLAGDSEVKQFFIILDKLDPVVAVWRYLDVFRAKLAPNIDEFLERLRHFFENPRVRESVSQNTTDVRLIEFTDQLQNLSRARAYHREKSVLPEELFALPEETILELIQGRRFEFASAKRSTPQRRKGS